MKKWEMIGVILFILWAFYGGYVIALGFSMGMSWSVRDVTLFFREGGMTGDVFISLYRFAQWAFIILTFCVLMYIPVMWKGSQK